jgi:hypothetical protein
VSFLTHLRRPAVIIDFEASSLPMPGSFPVEIAIGDIDTGEVTSWLIRPTDRWLKSGFWDPNAEKVHGLSREHLREHGRPAAEVAREVRATLKGKTLLSDYPEGEELWLGSLWWAGDIRDPLPYFFSVVHEIYDIANKADMTSDALESKMDDIRHRHPVVHRASLDVLRLINTLRIVAGVPLVGDEFMQQRQPS